MFMIFKLLQISLIHLLLASSNIHKKPIKLAKSLQEVPFSSSKYNHNMNYVNRTACIIHANRIILIQNLLVFFLLPNTWLLDPSYVQFCKLHAWRNFRIFLNSDKNFQGGAIPRYKTTLKNISKQKGQIQETNYHL